MKRIGTKIFCMLAVIFSVYAAVTVNSLMKIERTGEKISEYYIRVEMLYGEIAISMERSQKDINIICITTLQLFGVYKINCGVFGLIENT